LYRIGTTGDTGKYKIYKVGNVAYFGAMDWKKNLLSWESRKSKDLLGHSLREKCRQLDKRA
jgi:hypothetical protein